MANIKFCYTNQVDSDTTITSSSEATGFIDDNIYNIHYDVPWRTTSDTAEWIKFDFVSAISVTDFIIKHHNLTSGATLKIQANASDEWGDPSVDEELDITDDNIVKTWAAAQSYRWWRIYIYDGSNPDTYIELGYAFLGQSFQPTYNNSEPVEVEDISASETAWSGDSHPWIISRTGGTKRIYNFTRVDTTEISTFETLRDAVGQDTPFFAIEDPSSADTTCQFVIAVSSWKIQEWNYNGAVSVETRTW